MLQCRKDQIMGMKVPLSSLDYLLNIPPRQLGQDASRLLLHILTAAKCLIATFWKLQCLPWISLQVLKRDEINGAFDASSE